MNVCASGSCDQQSLAVLLPAGEEAARLEVALSGLALTAATIEAIVSPPELGQ